MHAAFRNRSRGREEAEAWAQLAGANRDRAQLAEATKGRAQLVATNRGGRSWPVPLKVGRGSPKTLKVGRSSRKSLEAGRSSPPPPPPPLEVQVVLAGRMPVPGGQLQSAPTLHVLLHVLGQPVHLRPEHVHVPFQLQTLALLVLQQRLQLGDPLQLPLPALGGGHAVPCTLPLQLLALLVLQVESAKGERINWDLARFLKINLYLV